MNYLLNAGSIVMICTMLTGCLSSSWVKAGSNDADLNRQRIACQAEAIRQLPPKMIADSEYDTSSSERCTKKHNHHYNDKQCEKAQERRTLRYRDININARDVLIQECMYRNGWSEVQIQ